MRQATFWLYISEKYAHKDRSLSILHEYDAYEERAMIRSG